MRILPLLPILLSLWLVACCEPGHKDAEPAIVADSFKQSYGKDLDVYSQNALSLPRADSAYYPIYTFGIRNSGSQDDDFTLHFRKPLYGGFVGGFDITKRVPAGATVMFRTPSADFDSTATYYFPNLINHTEQNPLIDKAMYGIQAPTPDSTEIHLLKPTITITYGAIDNGPEACNTPASVQTIDINELPRK